MKGKRSLGWKEQHGRTERAEIVGGYLSYKAHSKYFLSEGRGDLQRHKCRKKREQVTGYVLGYLHREARSPWAASTNGGPVDLKKDSKWVQKEREIRNIGSEAIWGWKAAGVGLDTRSTQQETSALLRASARVILHQSMPDTNEQWLMRRQSNELLWLCAACGWTYWMAFSCPGCVSDPTADLSEYDSSGSQDVSTALDKTMIQTT